ncbi:MAG: MarR family transcriptional regulator [Aeromicrobium sp.]
MTKRHDSLRQLEDEVGILLRRVKPVLAERAALVHPELQSASYLMLSWLAQQGPVRPALMAETFGIDKGAISRQLQHLVDLGLADRSADPQDGRATVVSASASAIELLQSVREQRREVLNLRLGDWTDADLAEFAATLSRYNTSLS